jgi:hypothetical protein
MILKLLRFIGRMENSQDGMQLLFAGEIDNNETDIYLPL